MGWKGRRVVPRLSESGVKVCNFLAIFYMEDLAEAGVTYGDLLRFLSQLQMRCAVSPVHDRDYFTADDVWKWCEQHIDPETGDLDTHYLDNAPYVGKQKKPHVHFLGMNPRQRSAQEMSELFAELFYVRPTIWERCIDPGASLRYFAHMNSPEKAQYSPYDIHGFGGIKLDALHEVSKSETAEITAVIIDVIRSLNLFYFDDLITAVYQMEDPTAQAVLFGRYSMFNQILGSRRQKKFDGEMAKKKGRENAKD